MASKQKYSLLIAANTLDTNSRPLVARLLLVYLGLFFFFG